MIRYRIFSNILGSNSFCLKYLPIITSVFGTLITIIDLNNSHCILQRYVTFITCYPKMNTGMAFSI